MQAMALDVGLDRRTPAGHQAHNTSGHTAASAATSKLVARASTGDQAAWDQLVERYAGLVWAVACAHDLSSQDAADVSQVTWLLLTQHLGSLQQPERLGIWLRRTATREAYRICRLRGREIPDACEDPSVAVLCSNRSRPIPASPATPSLPT